MTMIFIFFTEGKEMDVGIVTAAFSLATLALSRCRCVIRRTDSGVTEWGLGFTENRLLPEKPEKQEAPPE